MPQTRAAGPYPLPGVGMTTWMIRYDKNGRCVSPATRAAFLASLPPDRSKEVIFFSHGWKTDFEGAEELYAAFLQQLEKLSGADSVAGRDIVFVGVTWPSQWFPGTSGPDLAATGAQDPLSETLEDLAQALSPADAADLYRLAESVSLEEADAKRLVDLLGRATRPAEAEAPEVVDDTGPPDTETLLAAWRRIGKPVVTDFDTPGVAAGAGPAAGVLAAGGGLDPLDAIRIFSLYQMKDRAGRVGGGDVAAFLSDIAGKAKAVYAVGHSFGCKVMLSATKKAQLGGKAPTSLLLLQPALSHLAFASALPGDRGPAGYADVPAKTRRIFTTFSRRDQPLHDIFHLALLRHDDVGELDAAAAADEPPNRFAALGGYGPRGVGVDYDTLDLAANAAEYAAKRKTIVALNGDATIGGHTDVKTPASARALRRLMD